MDVFWSFVVLITAGLFISSCCLSALGVDVSELFVLSRGKQDIHGFIFVDGAPFVVNSKEELLKLMDKIDI